MNLCLHCLTSEAVPPALFCSHLCAEHGYGKTKCLFDNEVSSNNRLHAALASKRQFVDFLEKQLEKLEVQVNEEQQTADINAQQGLADATRADIAEASYARIWAYYNQLYARYDALAIKNSDLEFWVKQLLEERDWLRSQNENPWGSAND